MISRRRNIQNKRHKSKKGGGEKKNIKIYFNLIKLYYIDYDETEQEEAELEESDIEAIDTNVLHNYVNQSIHALKKLFSKKKTYKITDNDDAFLKFLNSIISFEIEKLTTLYNETYNFTIQIELSDYEQQLEKQLDILWDGVGSDLLIYTDRYHDNTNLGMGRHEITIS